MRRIQDRFARKKGSSFLPDIPSSGWQDPFSVKKVYAENLKLFSTILFFPADCPFLNTMCSAKGQSFRLILIKNLEFSLDRFKWHVPC